MLGNVRSVCVGRLWLAYTRVSDPKTISLSSSERGRLVVVATRWGCAAAGWLAR